LKHVPELKRLRLSSIDSIEADETLLRRIAEEERLMPHFHLSVQSGNNLILKRMKRRHLREDTIGFCDTIRRLRPEAAFGADLIAGFPTETEEMFESTLALIDEAGLSYLHVFPFSARKGTPAARMPQLPRGLIKERARRLREKGGQALAARLGTLVGREQMLLIERPGRGRTPCFAIAAYEDESAKPGSFVRARIQSSDGHILTARVVPPVEQQDLSSKGSRAAA
jgi:threonylcarbamoyladenosine tRNA methylthiotransferase MtaB